MYTLQIGYQPVALLPSTQGQSFNISAVCSVDYRATALQLSFSPVHHLINHSAVETTRAHVCIYWFVFQET